MSYQKLLVLAVLVPLVLAAPLKSGAKDRQSDVIVGSSGDGRSFSEDADLTMLNQPTIEQASDEPSAVVINSQPEQNNLAAAAPAPAPAAYPPQMPNAVPAQQPAAGYGNQVGAPYPPGDARMTGPYGPGQGGYPVPGQNPYQGGYPAPGQIPPQGGYAGQPGFQGGYAGPNQVPPPNGYAGPGPMQPGQAQAPGAYQPPYNNYYPAGPQQGSPQQGYPQGGNPTYQGPPPGQFYPPQQNPGSFYQPHGYNPQMPPQGFAPAPNNNANEPVMYNGAYYQRVTFTPPKTLPRHTTTMQVWVSKSRGVGEDGKEFFVNSGNSVGGFFSGLFGRK